MSLENFFLYFLEVLTLVKSIVDEPTPIEPEPTLKELADMLFLVFLAVKDLEVKVDGLLEERG
jgi:hypothetical protein